MRRRTKRGEIRPNGTTRLGEEGALPITLFSYDTYSAPPSTHRLLCFWLPRVLAFFFFYRTIQQSHETVDASCAQLVLFSLQYQHCFPFHNFRPPTIPPRNTGYLRFPSRVLALFPPALPLTELRRKGAGGGKKINPFFPGTYEGKNRIRYIFTAHASCVCRIQFGRSSGGSEEGDLSWVPLIFTTT